MRSHSEGTASNAARRWFGRRTIKRLLLGLALAAAGLCGVLYYDARALDSEVPRLAALLKLRPGSVVAEVGAGEGKLTVRVARLVGPTGRVLSTELAADRLAAIRRAAAKAGLENITIIPAGERDTNLPAECCDAVFMRKVYHHLTDPSAMDASLFRSLRPGGALVIVDFSPGTFFWLWRPKGVPQNRGGHGIPQKVLIEEVTQAGFRLVRAVDHWPGLQYAVLFRKPGR